MLGDRPWQLDPNEPPFTVVEMARARWLREQSIATPTRPDNCPHPVPCPDVATCLENIAWYLRYQGDIERALKADR